MYRKFRFSKGNTIATTGRKAFNPAPPPTEVTAALVLDSEELDEMSLPEISRLFPYSEAMKMMFLEMSTDYETEKEAFRAYFKAVKSIKVNINYGRNI